MLFALGGGKGGGGKGICKFFQQGSCTRGASCAFSHGDSGEDDDPDMAEIEAAIAKAQGTKKGDDADMMAELERLDEEHHQNMDVRDNDSNTDASDKLPPPASEAEIAEAQEIVKKAQEDLIERNKMKAKVGGASKDDLQAMINARLAKK